MANNKKNKIYVYPLSSAQRRIWVLSQLESNALSYNIGSLININEVLDLGRLQKTLDILVARHEVLRTNFVTFQNNEPVQIVRPEIKNTLLYYDLSREKKLAQKRRKILKDNSDFRFDLSRDSLLRVCIIKKRSNAYDFFVVMHHIISDIWSLAIFGNEFFHFYNQEKPGKKVYQPKKLSIQYKDFAAWEQSREYRAKIKTQEKYWLKELAGELPIIDLLSEQLRPSLQTYKTKNETLKIGELLAGKISSLCQDRAVTPYLFLLTVYFILLNKLTANDDLIVGTYAANRDLPELENVIGVFLNNLAIRLQVDPKQSFFIILEQVKEKVLSAVENKEYPFEMLIEKINPPRDLSRAPIFNTVFQMFSDDDRLKVNFFGRAGHRNFVFDNGMSQFDLTFKIFTDEKRLGLVLTYNTKLFKKESAKIFLQLYQEILEKFLNNPNQSIADLDIIPDSLKQKLIKDYNCTSLPLPHFNNIYELFVSAAKKYPRTRALSFSGESWTYEELLSETERAAAWFKSCGVKSGDIIAISMDRSEKLIIFLLAILKIGAAYLPINKAEPLVRLKYFLNNGNASFILTDGLISRKIKIPVLSTLKFNKFYTRKKVRTENAEKAYLIYTSGSTGQPKGVFISHSALLNFIFGIKKAFKFKAGKSILAATNYAFDIFFLESIASLCQGMTVVLSAEKDNLDPSLLRDMIVNQNVEILQFTPSHLESLLANQKEFSWLFGVKSILVGGENLPLSLLRKIKKIFPGEIFNMYGPTETCIWSLVANLTQANNIHLGRPLANTQVYVLDKKKKICPPGVIGEIYIAGNGLSAGYTDSKETNAAFVPNKISGHGLMYRTGDFAYFSSTGELNFVGRRDRQLKISGRRLDLSEIENCLSKFPIIQQVVVRNIIKHDGSTFLAAYYTARGEVAALILRNYLKKHLPDYLIPDYFLFLKRFPLNSNGKLDLVSLPEPDLSQGSLSIHAAPENETEAQIIKIWQQELGIKNLGRNENFFILGGHSLQLIKIFNQLENIFPGKLNIAQLFIYATPAALAGYLIGRDQLKDGVIVDYRSQASRLIAKVSRGKLSAAKAAKLFADL